MGGAPAAARNPRLTMKLCLAGDFKVGKTSLMRRFVSGTFDERYVTTLGAKVDSKAFSVPDPGADEARIDVGATIWDIMGNPGFRELLKDAYFHGAQGMLLICDATRPETVENLPTWYKAASSIAGDIPAVVLLNKMDLSDEVRVTPQDMDRICKPRDWPWLPTSAKTGENVDPAFEKVTEFHLAATRKSRASKAT